MHFIIGGRSTQCINTFLYIFLGFYSTTIIYPLGFRFLRGGLRAIVYLKHRDKHGGTSRRRLLAAHQLCSPSNNNLIIGGKDENGKSTLTHNHLGEMGVELMKRGRFRDAKGLLAALLEMQKEQLGEDHQAILTTQY
jgi:hypothetical protein